MLVRSQGCLAPAWHMLATAALTEGRGPALIQLWKVEIQRQGGGECQAGKKGHFTSTSKWKADAGTRRAALQKTTHGPQDAKGQGYAWYHCSFMNLTFSQLDSVLATWEAFSAPGDPSLGWGEAAHGSHPMEPTEVRWREGEEKGRPAAL